MPMISADNVQELEIPIDALQESRRVEMGLPEWWGLANVLTTSPNEPMTTSPSLATMKNERLHPRDRHNFRCDTLPNRIEYGRYEVTSGLSV